MHKQGKIMVACFFNGVLILSLSLNITRIKIDFYSKVAILDILILTIVILIATIVLRKIIK